MLAMAPGTAVISGRAAAAVKVLFGPLIAGSCQAAFLPSIGTAMALAPSKLAGVAEMGRARMAR
jgi:hypothetical protein